MKQTTLLLFLFFGYSTLVCSQNNNYILIIDGDSIALDLNKDLKHTIRGKAVQLKLIQPQNLQYSDDLIAFKYPNDLSVAKTPLDGDIEQLMVMRATGTGYMIQTYKSFNPSLLVDLMLNEITKESVSYGYAKTVTPFEYTLQSGQVLKGSTATLTYKGEEELYTVAAYGAKDQGVLVMTMMLSDESSKKEDETFLKEFLNSLQIR
jgi:hypothetical protein